MEPEGDISPVVLLIFFLVGAVLIVAMIYGVESAASSSKAKNRHETEEELVFGCDDASTTKVNRYLNMESEKWEIAYVDDGFVTLWRMRDDWK